MEATFDSLDKLVAKFVLAGEDKLVDATTYTVSADWATFTEDTVMAKVAAKYVDSLSVVTTAITATPRNEDGEYVSKETVVTFAGKDQHNEDIALGKMDTAKVEITLNGVLPLVEKSGATNNDFSFDKSTGKLIIYKDLDNKDTLSIKLSNVKTVDGKEVVLATETFDFEVKAAEASKVTSIVVNAGKVSLPAKEGTTLDVKVLNQSNNEINEGVTFVVNGKVVTPGSATDIIQLNAGKYTFKTSTPGVYKIVVFPAKDSKITATTTITVGAATLTGLTVDTDTTDKTVTKADAHFNKEDLIIAKVAPSEGAALTPENLKFNIVTTTKDVTAEDITVTAANKTVGKGEAAKEVIVIKATSTKPGTFVVTPYVGETFVSEEVIKGNAITLTTVKNPNVKTISDITFDEAELKVGSTIKKAVVFINKNGEEIDVAGNDLKATLVGTGLEAGDVTLLQADTETGEDGAEATTQPVKFIELKPSAKGTVQLTLSTGKAIGKAYSLTFSEAEVTTVVAGENIEGVVAGDNATLAKYVVPQFKDQDGKVIDWIELVIKVRFG